MGYSCDRRLRRLCRLRRLLAASAAFLPPLLLLLLLLRRLYCCCCCCTCAKGRKKGPQRGPVTRVEDDYLL